MEKAADAKARGLLTTPERLKTIRHAILRALADGKELTEQQINERLDADADLWELLGADDEITREELRSALAGMVNDSKDVVRGGPANAPTFRLDEETSETLAKSAAANQSTPREKTAETKAGAVPPPADAAATPTSATPAQDQSKAAAAPPTSSAKPDGKTARTFTREELIGHGLPLAPTKGVEVLSKKQISAQGDTITNEVIFRLPAQPTAEAWRTTYRSSASLGDCETWEPEVVAQRVKLATQTVVSVVSEGHEDEAPIAVLSVVKAGPASEAKPAGEKTSKKEEKPDPRFPREREMEWSEDMTAAELHAGYRRYRELHREYMAQDSAEESARADLKERMKEIEEARSKLSQQMEALNDQVQNGRVKRRERVQERFNFAKKQVEYYRSLGGERVLVPQLTRPMTSDELASQPLFRETPEGWVAAGKEEAKPPEAPAPSAPQVATAGDVPNYDLTKASENLLRESTTLVEGKVAAGATNVDGRRMKAADALLVAGLVTLVPIAGSTNTTVKATPAGVAFVAKLTGRAIAPPPAPLVTDKGPDVTPPVLKGDPAKPSPPLASTSNGASKPNGAAAAPAPAAGKTKPKGGRSSGGRGRGAGPSARA
jgi:hypothetical protein